MSTPAAKKRRIDTANATLRRPFTSPIVKRPLVLKDPTPSKAPPLNSKETSAAVDALSSKKPPASVRDPSGASPHRAHKAPFTPKPKSLQSSHKDNTLLSLITTHKKGQLQCLKQLDQELEAVHQAQRIASQSESRRPGEPVDQELRDLVAKWKSGSRLAADELFEIVKERVSKYVASVSSSLSLSFQNSLTFFDSAGGIKAWKEMQQKQLQFYQGLEDTLAPQSETQRGDDHDDDEFPNIEHEPDGSPAASESLSSTQETLEEADEVGGSFLPR